MVGDKPIGTCYEDAWRFLIREEEGELVHGSVQTIGERINHAWVELPAFVWEPRSGELIKKSDFYEMAEPREQARYTTEEAAIMAARTKNLGPWSAQERELLKGRSNVATANPAIEEGLAQEIARYLIAKRQPILKAAELESIFKELGYGEKELRDFTSYIETQEGKDFFRKSMRLELYKAGYRPREEPKFVPAFPGALFPLGQLVTTAGVDAKMKEDPKFEAFVRESIARHHRGDWGIMPEEDKKSNEEALRIGERLMSAYEQYPLPKIWIITERDRSATTVLFPEEY